MRNERLIQFCKLPISEVAKFAAEIGVDGPQSPDFEKQQRDRDLEIVRSLAKQKPYCDQAWARMALAIAASAIERGRLLTDAEKNENLAKAFDEEGDHDTAAKIRGAR